MEIIPIYRDRDGRRGRNSERIRDVAAVYLGGGVTDHLLEAILGTPAAEALARKLAEGGVVVAIAAAAQCAGRFARSIFEGRPDPRLRLAAGRAWWSRTSIPPTTAGCARCWWGRGCGYGLGIPAGSAVLLGPGGGGGGGGDSVPDRRGGGGCGADVAPTRTSPPALSVPATLLTGEGDRSLAI